MYSTGPLSYPIPDAGTVDVPLRVLDKGPVSYLEVWLRIDHPRDSDLTLSLVSPSGTTVVLSAKRGGNASNYGVGRPVAGRLVVGPWSEALSEWAGRPLRLVRIDEIGAGVDRGALAPVSLVSRASLEALQAAARADGPVDGRRFRMLFGIDGVAAHEEDVGRGEPREVDLEHRREVAVQPVPVHVRGVEGGEDEPPAGAEHAAQLGEGARAIEDVDDDRHEGTLEPAVLEGQALR